MLFHVRLIQSSCFNGGRQKQKKANETLTFLFKPNYWYVYIRFHLLKLKHPTVQLLLKPSSITMCLGSFLKRASCHQNTHVPLTIFTKSTASVDSSTTWRHIHKGFTCLTLAEQPGALREARNGHMINCQRPMASAVNVLVLLRLKGHYRESERKEEWSLKKCRRESINSQTAKGL